MFSEQERWGRPLGASVVFHVAVVVLVSIWASLHRGFTMWGAAGAGALGGSVAVTAVDSIPLPSPPSSPTPNVLATQSPGLSQSPPRQAEKPADEAIPISGKASMPKKEPEQPAPAKQPQQPIAAQPANQVPYGQGGPANTLQFNMGTGTGGLSVSGAGDFAGLYGWYVDQVRQKLSQNWYLYQVDPAVPVGSEVTVQFEITRGGQPANMSLKQSSGYPTLDSSAMAALKRVDTFGPLPADYRGSSVKVEFYFRK